jgi:hypothetical protein
MRVVVDEGVPRQLAAALQRAGLDAHRFKSIWKGFTNVGMRQDGSRIPTPLSLAEYVEVAEPAA